MSDTGSGAGRDAMFTEMFALADNTLDRMGVWLGA